MKDEKYYKKKRKASMKFENVWKFTLTFEKCPTMQQ